MRYNSKNISEINYNEFNTAICAGAYGLKWKANKYPDEDYSSIRYLIENLKTIEKEKIIYVILFYMKETWLFMLMVGTDMKF